MPRTRSTANAEAFRDLFVADVLPLLVQNEWAGAAELAAVETTCRGGRSSDATWRDLALLTWPDAVSAGLVGTAHDEKADGDDSEGDDAGSASDDGRNPAYAYATYRDLYVDYPRAWLRTEAERVRRLEAWSKARHVRRGAVLECGRCGCNCNNGSLCPGIPITGEFRWERREQKDWPDNKDFVPAGEGYELSGGTMIGVNRFCEPCFDRLVGLGIVEAEDYDRTPGTTIFREVTDRIVHHEGDRPNDGTSNIHYGSDFFTTTESESWQSNLGLETDDAAAVIAAALADPRCAHRHLNISALHFNDDYGERGYRAMAFALAVNTSLRSLEMQFDECCYATMDNYDAFADRSKGLFTKALRHNRGTSLHRLVLCYVAFGNGTYERKIKPHLKEKPPVVAQAANEKRAVPKEKRKRIA